MKFFLRLSFLLLILAALFFTSCAGSAASAQEYFSIGMAYFELGKYEEAEKWLSRARSKDRTMVASQYNLGRLAFETQRYNEAARLFEGILKRDPDNILALKAAAYTRIKTGDISIAEKHYARLLELVPESADDGYNHALVLYAMGRYSDAEEVLERHLVTLHDNMDTLLLYARCQAAQNKIEAINNFSVWLLNNTDAKVRHEYAQVLEQNNLFARALEEYRTALTEIPETGGSISRGEVRFGIARVLLVAEAATSAGITELQAAISEGFDNLSSVEPLVTDGRISLANRNTIRTIAANMQRTQAQALPVITEEIDDDLEANP